jgi:hypothetical protein
MKLISAFEAKKLKLTRYFTGQACKRGHVAERRTDNLSCVECVREKDRRRDKSEMAKRAWAARKAKPGHSASLQRKRYRENSLRDNIRAQKWRASPAGQKYLAEYLANPETKARRRRAAGLPEPTRPEPTMCECCGGPPVGRGRGLHLDHCHVIGVFRGWLCGKCNCGLGMFQESPQILARATQYLNRNDPTAKERWARLNIECDMDDVTPE